MNMTHYGFESKQMIEGVRVPCPYSLGHYIDNNIYMQPLGEGGYYIPLHSH